MRSMYIRKVTNLYVHRVSIPEEQADPLMLRFYSTHFIGCILLNKSQIR